MIFPCTGDLHLLYLTISPLQTSLQATYQLLQHINFTFTTCFSRNNEDGEEKERNR